MCTLLDISNLEMNQYSGQSNEYSVFLNEDGRLCQEPNRRLKKIHKRIEILFKRVNPPDYLHSVKGRSYVSNARIHSGKKAIAICDIEQFYPSTKYGHVYQFFFEDLQCAKDVSTILSRIVCFQGHLPTGSPVSGQLAYFAHRGLFDQIYLMAQKEGIEFTLYVDDLSFSADKVTPGFINHIRVLARKRGLITHKERFFKKTDYKLLTGVGINAKGAVVLPNQRHKAIYDLMKATSRSTSNNTKDIERLLGRLNEAAQIDGSFSIRAKSISEALKKRS